VKVAINALKIPKGLCFSENHLVEAWYEVRIHVFSVEDGKTKATSSKSEVTQMIRVDARGWIDLQGVVIV
jgi:hypothetical protein